MSIITNVCDRYCKTQKQVVKFQNELSKKYFNVRLIRFPDRIGDPGMYVFEFGDEITSAKLKTIREHETELHALSAAIIADLEKEIAQLKRAADHEFVKTVDTWNTGGHVYNDLITLKDGTVIRISDGAVVVYKTIHDMESENETGHIYF